MKIRILLATAICLAAGIVILVVWLHSYDKSPYLLNKRELIEFTKRAEHGDGVAARCLGFHYDYLRDEGRMLYWFRKSAENGNQESKLDMYYILMNFRHIEPQERKEALENLIQAAAMNYPPAEQELASLYFEGKLLKKDIELAQMLATKAAESGDKSAMEYLPVILMDRKVNRSDLIEAYKWTIIALSRIDSESVSARHLREQEEEILRKISEDGKVTKEEIINEASKLAQIQNKKIPKSPDIIELKNREMYEVCHPKL